jgi:hypothetical protein
MRLVYSYLIYRATAYQRKYLYGSNTYIEDLSIRGWTININIHEVVMHHSIHCHKNCTNRIRNHQLMPAFLSYIQSIELATYLVNYIDTFATLYDMIHHTFLFLIIPAMRSANAYTIF